jgi:ADP-ribosylglycohydrolase
MKPARSGKKTKKMANKGWLIKLVKWRSNMNRIHLNEDEYRSKVYGGWMGKNIGGTLGGPVEGRKELMELDFYPVLSDGPMPNDDLDLQLVWLHAVEQYGARLTSKELGQEWAEHVFFPFDEYGYALANLRRGLKPPVAGWFNNPFTNCMGSPIRSEIWAMLCPGAPATAAWYAYQDAIVDHAGGEGVYGEMFFAAIESAAFLQSDRDALLNIGLGVIPPQSRTYKAVHDLRQWHREGRSWTEARELVLEHHGHPNFTDAPQNIAFTILGWLYGEDFGDAILKAVNCGYDTDCTGATLGAILGIIGGEESLPEKWVEPVGNRVAVSPPIKGFPAPADLEELADRTLYAAREVLGAWNLPIDITNLTQTLINKELYNEKGLLKVERDPAKLWYRSFQEETYPLPAGTSREQAFELSIDYGQDGPSIGLNAAKSLILKLRNNSQETWKGALGLTLPAGWDGPGEKIFTLAPIEELVWEVTVRSGNDLCAYYPIHAYVQRYHDKSPWSREVVTFHLISASRWTVKGPDSHEEVELICSGNRIEFEKAFPQGKNGRYTARTILRNPFDRPIRLIAGTAAPLKLKLDGRVLIEDENSSAFMPAFHRAPENRRVELFLTAGDHHLEVEIERGCKDLRPDEQEIYMLPVAVGNTETPGSYYYLVDVLFI